MPHGEANDAVNEKQVKRPLCEPEGFTARHGTEYGYQQGCHCPDCYEGFKTAQKARFARGAFKHTAAGYRLGCRCDACKVAYSAYQRDRRARQKAAQE